MKRSQTILCFVLALGLRTGTSAAQVYTPGVLAKGQVDTGDLVSMAKSIYTRAGAVAPRQKAEAIWRFFLTDGRFVSPGFWYHIAGWTYEEPQGEVLDPLKLLNSYGFGLCYHIAPLLEAVYEAGGFEDARVWFLTGHTVTEVYYDGAYHHFDSDMMGYTPVGSGDPKMLPVASVSQIARDGGIILGKLKSSTRVDVTKVDDPWYPADLREAAMGGLVELFTSTKDNWLYSFTRYPQAHSMTFVLRPGERLVRYFQPETEDLFYLPFKFDGTAWTEFPQEVSQYKIRTEDGPRSQKDNRRWATGRIEYSPVLSDRASYYPGSGAGLDANLRLPDPKGGREYLGREKASAAAYAVFEMQSPYVLMDAQVALEALLQQQGQSLEAEISVDGGRSWQGMGKLAGPFRGEWRAQPAAKTRSPHGNLTAVSGKYQYLIRLIMTGPEPSAGIQLRKVQIVSRFQLNPRTLPELVPGRNGLVYRPGGAIKRDAFAVDIDQLSRYALRTNAVQCVSERGQSILWPDDGRTAEILFELSAPDHAAISGFDVGARFLDLRAGLAPDKLTAETRTTGIGQKSAQTDSSLQASIEWSTSLSGAYTRLWEYNPTPQCPDGISVTQVLRWPEVDRSVRSLPGGTRKVYIRYRLKGMGMDNPRLAVLSPRAEASQVLEVIHQWFSEGQRREHIERIDNPRLERNYWVETGQGKDFKNHALVLYCPPAARRAQP